MHHKRIFRHIFYRTIIFTILISLLQCKNVETHQDIVIEEIEKTSGSSVSCNEIAPLHADTGNSPVQNASLLDLPKFPSKEFSFVKLCREKEIIRVPVYDSDFAIIPCFTNYRSNPATKPIPIQLYKWTEGTELKLITEDENDTGIKVEYIEDVGFKLNRSEWDTTACSSNDSCFLGKYICIVANSTGESHVIAELYKNDHFVNITATGSPETCSLEFHSNGLNNSFTCQVRRELYENSFEWFFVLENNDKCLNVSQKTRTQYEYGDFIGEKIKLNFPSTDVKGLLCRVRKKLSEEWTHGSLPLKVKAYTKPVILDAGKTSRVFEKGMHLTCLFKIDTVEGLTKHWLKDGQESISHNTHSYMNPITHTYNYTLYNITDPDDKVNYTCVISNRKGSTSRSFIVSKNTTWNYIIYIFLIVGGIIILAIILMYYRQQKRQLQENRQKAQQLKEERQKVQQLEEERQMQMEQCIDLNPYLRQLIERDTNQSSKLKVDFGMNKLSKLKYKKCPQIVVFEKIRLNFVVVFKKENCTFLGEGRFGEVKKAKLTLLDGSEVDAVLKSPKWLPDLSTYQNHLLCKGFIEEIKTIQELRSSDGQGHPNVVRYLGFNAPDIKFLKIYCIFEFCHPGSLEIFLMDCEKNQTFENDIIDEQMVHTNRDGYSENNFQCVRTSNLMIWAEQSLAALNFIHDRDLVHRDLATRNMLLQLENGTLVLKISDFGMARILNGSDAYIWEREPINIPESKRKPRILPVFWYAPEALGTNPRYTQKSDVWSWGSTIWEMFCLSTQTPFQKFVKSSEASSLRHDLQSIMNEGRKPSKEDLYLPMPQKLWNLTQRCWNIDCDSRPSIAQVYADLKDMNENFYKLYSYDEETDSYDEETESYDEETAESYQEQTENGSVLNAVAVESSKTAGRDNADPAYKKIHVVYL